MPFFGSPAGLSELKQTYRLRDDFPQGLIVTRNSFRVCNNHSKCVGGFSAGTKLRGVVLDEFTFLYEDGTQDNGRMTTKCECKDGENTFAWIEE